MIQVFLYEFTQGTTIYRGTNRNADITVLGNAYGAIDITHDAISKTADLSDSGTNITLATKNPDDPVYSFLAGAPAEPIHVKIMETYGPAFSQIFTLFEADVKSVKFTKAAEIQIALTSLLRIGDQQAPRVLVQLPCNWNFGEPHTCKKDLSLLVRTGIIGAIAGNTVAIEACHVEAVARGDVNWFALGKIVTGSETRKIMAQAGAVLTLSAPLRAAHVGDAVAATPGCDRRWATCGAKYANTDNFGAMPFLPLYNPLVSQGYMPQASGKKGTRSSK